MATAMSDRGPSLGGLRIGTSGYQYDHWKGLFYPEDLPRQRWFEHYAREFDTVEINTTFYHLPAASTFEVWRNQAPAGFCYALKFSRYGTHIKRLKDAGRLVDSFLDRARGLANFLGPILVQLPPRWKVSTERLAGFLNSAHREFRWSIELRDPSWLIDEVFAILEEHNAALCIHDMLAEHPRRITADWTYLRFHGDRYGGSYSPQFLTAQAARIRDYLRRGLDVFAHFNNDLGGHAVRNAAALKRYLAAR